MNFCLSGKPKPPPPPRSQSLEAFEKHGGGGLETEEPTVPAPPSDTVYANLGTAVRSGLVPHKPQRTGSMRTDPPPPPSQVHAPFLAGQMKLGADLSVPSPNSQLGFHAKTDSSVSESETSLSGSSTTAARKNGSEADSERDSVSPMRITDEVRQFGQILKGKNCRGWMWNIFLG